MATSSNVSQIHSAEVTLASSEPTKRCYAVSLAGERLRAVESRWFDLARSNARIPGFRKGHVPEEVLMKQMGDWLKGKIINELLQSVIGEIVRRDQLKVVSAASVEKVDYKMGDRLTFEVVFQVEPEVTVKDYKGITLKRYKRPVKDEDVEREFRRLLTGQAPVYLVPVEGPADLIQGLWVLVNLDYYLSQAQEPVWSVRYFMVSLQDPVLPYGLRDAVAGLKAGESKETAVVWDEDCPLPELRGKTGRMRVELLELKRQWEPEGSAAGAENLDEAKRKELRDQIRKALEERSEARAQKLMRDQVVAAILEANPVEVAQVEIERRTQELLERARAIFAMAGRGLTAEHEEELRVKYRVEAADDVRFSYLAREIARRENLSVTEEDIKKRLEEAPEEEREHLARDRDSLAYDILMDKVFERLLAKANIENVEV